LYRFVFADGLVIECGRLRDCDEVVVGVVIDETSGGCVVVRVAYYVVCRVWIDCICCLARFDGYCCGCDVDGEEWMIDVDFVVGVVVDNDVLMICVRRGFVSWIWFFDGNVSWFITI
jgi:hypothetical protein